jgi:hypothetical protein
LQERKIERGVDFTANVIPGPAHNDVPGLKACSQGFSSLSYHRNNNTGFEQVFVAGPLFLGAGGARG